MQPGESLPVRVDINLTNGGNPQLVIRWTSHSGEKFGPVRQYLVNPPGRPSFRHRLEATFHADQ
jgi:hypothetical protein